MSENSMSRKTLGPKALEMVMRDVLGGLEDFAILSSLETGDTLEVVPLDEPLESIIENNRKSKKVPQASVNARQAEVVCLQKYRRNLKP